MNLIGLSYFLENQVAYFDRNIISRHILNKLWQSWAKKLIRGNPLTQSLQILVGRSEKGFKCQLNTYRSESNHQSQRCVTTIVEILEERLPLAKGVLPLRCELRVYFSIWPCIIMYSPVRSYICVPL